MDTEPPGRPASDQLSSARLDGLHRIICAANSGRTFGAALQTVAETVADVMAVDICAIYLFDRAQERLYLRATQGLNPAAIDEVNLALGQGSIGRAAQAGHPIVVPDISRDPSGPVDPLLNEPSTGSLVAVPIILFAQYASRWNHMQLEGVLTIQTGAARSFSDEAVHFLEVIAGQLAFAIDNAQRFEQTDERLQQKLRELATLQSVSAALTSTLDRQQVLQLIVARAVSLAKADRAEIFEHAATDAELLLVASSGGQADERLRPIIWRAVTSGQLISVLDPTNDPRFPELAETGAARSYPTVVCLPLQINARTTGALALYRRSQQRFEREEQQLLATFADHAAIALENARLYSEVQRALRIKETLLAELQHRVGNNLQVIQGLLQAQVRRLEPGSLGAISLLQSIDRIHAIAAVHQLLSQGEIGSTTIAQVAQQVLGHAAQTVDVPIQVSVQGPAITLPSRVATVLALVLNELAHNALRHGLAAEGGVLEIEVAHTETELVVVVRDDGPQHPGGMRPPSTGLGHTILRRLVEDDLGGTFDFERDERWARATIHVPATVVAAGAEEAEARSTE